MFIYKDKDKYEKLIATQREYSENILNKGSTDVSVRLAEKFFKILFELKDSLLKKKATPLKDNNIEDIVTSVNKIIAADEAKGINNELCLKVFSFVISFGLEGVPTDVYKTFKATIFGLFDFLLTMDSKGFKPFDGIKNQNFDQTFINDIFMFLLHLNREKFTKFMDSFHVSFNDLSACDECTKWFNLFIQAVESLSEDETQNWEFVFKVVYMFISFITENIINIDRPLGVIRKLWKTDNKEIRKQLEELFTRELDKDRNSLLIISFLLFLLDNKAFNEDDYSDLISDTQAMTFIVYIAIVSFFDISGVYKDKFVDYIAKHGDSKILPQKTLDFIKTAQDLCEKPWSYAKTNIILPGFNVYPDMQNSLPDFDIDDINLTKEDILEILNDETPWAISLYINTVLYIADLCPQAVLANPRPNLCKCFLPVLTKPDNLLICDKSFLYLISDITIQKVLPKKVYSWWIEKLVIDTFSGCRPNRMFALRAISQTIRMMMPGAQLIIPLFFYLLQTDYNKERWNILELSNAFASAHVIRPPKDNSQILKIMKRRKIVSQSFENFNIDAVFSDISTIFNVATYEKKADVYVAAIQTIIEDSIHHYDTKTLHQFLLNNITRVPPGTLYALFAFTEVDQYCNDIIVLIVGSLLNMLKKDAISIAVDLIIQCNHVDFTGALPLLLNVIEGEEYQDIKRHFVHEYLRYPYQNGIEFHESHINMFNESTTPLIFSDSEKTFVTGHHNVNNAITIMMKTSEGSSAIRSRPSTNYKPMAKRTCSSLVIAKPLTDMKPIWGDFASYEPIPLPDIKQPVNSSPRKPKETVERCLSPIVGKTKVIYPLADGLVNIGILNSSNAKYNSIENTPGALREAKAFFSMPTRETHKIALIYVSKGVRLQEDIIGLQEEDATSKFFNFAGKLGWPVDMHTHVGFTGGLDTNKFSTGDSSIYWADSMHELMWHVAPMLKVKDIYKKRYIGNDMVHVVYSDDSVEYDVSTITSQFNHAHIVIYPLGGRRYCVKVSQKDEVGWFGLLRGTSIVSEDALPNFVRFTAIFADSRARSSSSNVLVNRTEMINASRDKIWDMHNDENPLLVALEYD